MNIYDCLMNIREGKWETAGEDVQYKIINNNNELVLSFQGSNSTKDWINNFLFWKNKYQVLGTTIKAHHGFLKCWKSAENIIIEKIRNISPKKIIITGHSLGGAIGILCFLKLKEVLPESEIKLVTFGAPKCLGFKNWNKIKKYFSESTIQLKNNSDFVTWNPPFFLFYHHVTKLTHIGNQPHIFPINIFSVGHDHDTPWYKKTLDKLNQAL